MEQNEPHLLVASGSEEQNTGKILSIMLVCRIKQSALSLHPTTKRPAFPAANKTSPIQLKDGGSSTIVCQDSRVPDDEMLYRVGSEHLNEVQVVGVCFRSEELQKEDLLVWLKDKDRL